MNTCTVCLCVPPCMWYLSGHAVVCLCVPPCMWYLSGHAEASGENREAVTDGRVVYATSIKCLPGEHLFFTELLGATGGERVSVNGNRKKSMYRVAYSSLCISSSSWLAKAFHW